jgi:hypothetical protein
MSILETKESLWIHKEYIEYCYEASIHLVLTITRDLRLTKPTKDNDFKLHAKCLQV